MDETTERSTASRAAPDPDRLLLEWHRVAPTLEPEAFRFWALAGLREGLAFDGCDWQSPLHRHREGADVAAGTSRAPPAARTLAIEGDAGDATIRQSLRLSREPGSTPFEAAERALFDRLAPHLLLAHATSHRGWWTRLQFGARVGDDAAALADRDGPVRERSPRFVALLQREWAGWRGDRLPPALLELAPRRGAPSSRYLGRRIAVDLVSSGRSLVVVARTRHAADALTGREAEVARHYAAGSTFRQIAEGLGLAPATVRSHLRNVFAKLQVRNKTQLAAALR